VASFGYLLCIRAHEERPPLAVELEAVLLRLGDLAAVQQNGLDGLLVQLVCCCFSLVKTPQKTDGALFTLLVCCLA